MKKKATKTKGTDFRFMKTSNNERKTTIITSVMRDRKQNQNATHVQKSNHAEY